MSFKLPDNEKCTIAIIGLGYVGLPLALEFARKKYSCIKKKKLNRKIIGFDISQKRIHELDNGIDKTNECDLSKIKKLDNLEFTNDIADLDLAEVFIITVPTPIDDAKKPELSALKKACKFVGIALKRNISLVSPVVIFESTVFPGATEEICIPIIKLNSGLSVYDKLENIKSFGFGYSPERINPGDDKHKLNSITKVTSGNNEKVAEWVDSLYSSIIDAGTYKTKTIKVAEAAKVIENTQRDLNIALINELSIVFRKLDIDTLQVLEAAKTKWNFIPFVPGLVGGHCIGVDPYYLTFKSEQVGYSPEVVLAGRKINDGMATWYVEQIILEMVKRGMKIVSSNALILGFTFKENCPDIRNTKVIDMVRAFKQHSIKVDIFDPFADKENAKDYYDIEIHKELGSNKKYSIIVVAVAHDDFIAFDYDNWKSLCNEEHIILDLKGIVPLELNPIRP
ncbi:nucleotide sugar dehydrogenase [Prochlorococcus marinus XMU1412]|uniref:nucleotide sugar dehydrogenase n=1 Tax=Prochlorococcus marinus TaxID=1219 RepID=UPI001B2751D4|nr:nucleotide sugar dehydrogenase [Prochlorococcus marinus]MBO8240519.1 nucleotide sugar dehydrogenase [Prochlorococcus marinus XMU1412]MBW3071753.1 Vi polysaccharide biosynthesis protein VipA/TviB [Prochlorococcus marinus str. MU1412]